MPRFGAKGFEIAPRPAFFRLIFFSRTAGRCKPAFRMLVFRDVSLVAGFKAANRRNNNAVGT
jgi:hypothetical protein